MKYAMTALANRLYWPFPRRITGHHEGKVIVIDFLRIENATLKDCTLVYGGGSLTMTGCTIDSPSFVFFGRAGRALKMLHAINAMGGSDAVARTFGTTSEGDGDA